MKFNYSRLIPLALIISLLMALIPLAPVYAADLLSIAPNPIVNDVDNSITVMGSGFDSTAVVLLDGATLSTGFVSDQKLTAIVPAGISAGSYKITVSMSGGLANGFAVLTVNAPPSTATPGPKPFTRPQFVVRSSKAIDGVQVGKEFKLKVVLENAGSAKSYNTQAVFSSADFLPTKNGGVAVLGTVAADDEIVT